MSVMLVSALKFYHTAHTWHLVKQMTTHQLVYYLLCIVCQAAAAEGILASY